MPQDESVATHARMLKKDDAVVDWTLPAAAIERRIRAFDPWPGCETRAPRGTLRLLAASAAVREPSGAEDRGAGTVLGPEMMVSKKPGGGIPLEAAGQICGRRLARDVAPDRILRWTDLVEE